MRILIVRIAAYGDILITTPLIRYLKSQGNEIYYLGSEQAKEILENNPNIDKFIYHKRNSIANDKLDEYFNKIQKDNECEKVINLCESIEVRLALSPDYPQWNWTKKERREYCNKNYYEWTFEIARSQIGGEINLSMDEWKKFPISENKFYRPAMFFTEEEEDFILNIRQQYLGNKIIMWGLSGSGRQKTYPYVPYIVGDIMREMKNVIIILVGGETCKILEAGFPNHKRILKKSGEFNIRQSILMAKYADLVISPDTGFLHGAGCWDTPKIGLLTHSTKENITKHFTEDYSIESSAICAPCFRLISDASIQCILEPESSACLCMSKDCMRPEDIYERVKDVIGRN
jgi:ADP-heptose:LPS heptosyltransferase